MVFNTFEFAFFFAIVFGLYLVLPQRGQNRMLLLASYVFYGAWDWRFLSLLALSTVIDYTVGLRLAASEDPRTRRAWVTLSLASNLGILGFFKYAGFFADSLSELFLLFGIELPAFTLEIVLPVGISFYTFQTLSYTIDIYRRRIEPTRQFLDFALFVAFFPQLVAGPIERASNLLPQILGRREVTWEKISSGSWLVLWGLYKKVVIADNLAAVVNAVYRPASQPTSAEIVLATFAFAYQIYCDFSGYTDIARGIARMMGFNIMLNFNIPYAAVNPSDFWRRWHISLSTWLRDYLYVPLGGNRGGTLFTYRNLFLTMLLGGIWHGAAWPFVFWGAYHGALLIAHRLLEPYLAGIAPTSGLGRTAWRGLRCTLMFLLVCLGWLMFRAETLGHMTGLLATLVGPFELGLAGQWILPFCTLTAPLIAMQIAQSRCRDLEAVLHWPFALRVAVYASVMILIILLGEEIGSPFVYFQF